MKLSRRAAPRLVLIGCGLILASPLAPRLAAQKREDILSIPVSYTHLTLPTIYSV